MQTTMDKLCRSSSFSFLIPFIFLSSSCIFINFNCFVTADEDTTTTASVQDWQLPSDVHEEIVELQSRGIGWLNEKRNDEFGWDSGDTPRAVLVLASSVDEWPAQHDLEARITVKQLEIELLEKLIRHNVEPVTPARISFYSLALNAGCKDPRDFYGHNLIASLEKHSADQDYPGFPEAFGFSLTAFVSCLSGSHLHRKQIHHLIAIANDESSFDSIDTRSMAIMSLECFRRKRRSETLTKHIGIASRKVSRLQQEDGSFGNIHTTTMAIQALAMLTNEVGRLNWNRTAAALALVSMQRADGSFLGSTHATADAVIAATTLLNGDGLLKLKRGRCTDYIHGQKSYRVTDSSLNSQTTYTIVQAPAPNYSGVTNEQQQQSSSSSSSSSNNGGVHSNAIQKEQKSTDAAADDDEGKKNSITSTQSATDSTPSVANIRYWIWIGPDPVTAEKHNISLPVPVNSTFFVVMRRAAELNPNFEFSSTVWPNGHYVHTISGHREQPVGYHYWLLYHLPNDPDPLKPPPTTFVTPSGVDSLIVQDRDVYLFWYKKL